MKNDFSESLNQIRIKSFRPAEYIPIKFYRIIIISFPNYELNLFENKTRLKKDQRLKVPWT